MTARNEVHIEVGDDVSRMLYEASKLTYENRPDALVELHESFSGTRAFRPGYFNDVYTNMGSDGVGTKIEISERLEDHSVVAHDLFAMACDDAVVRGAEPVGIATVLDVRELDDSDETWEAVNELAQGYVEAAKMAGVVVVNGETAELGSRVGGYGNFNYNWCSTVLWRAEEDKLITGKEICPEDYIVGFAEDGFRSNGITDVRNTMLEHYGAKWHDEVEISIGELSLGRLVQTPSIIYSKLVTALNGSVDIDPLARISGVANITGGGQPSKIARMLESSGYGVLIDDPIEPPAIMTHVNRLSGFSDEQAYKKWHMGPGMIVATKDPEIVIAKADDFDVDAKIIGVVCEEPGILIKNMGAVGLEEYLRF